VFRGLVGLAAPRCTEQQFTHAPLPRPALPADEQQLRGG
jgi:hypothetical protein